jgi:hypothetical protein
VAESLACSVQVNQRCITQRQVMPGTQDARVYSVVNQAGHRPSSQIANSGDIVGWFPIGGLSQLIDHYICPPASHTQADGQTLQEE